MRTYVVNQAFRFVKGNWLHRKSRQIRHYFSRKRPILPHLCAACSNLPSYISTMNYTWAQTCSFKHLNTMLAIHASFVLSVFIHLLYVQEVVTHSV